jgi:hypothetical protein
MLIPICPLRHSRNHNRIVLARTYTTTPGAVAWPLPGFFFSFFAQRSPHALHSVLGPVGPFRHSGESSVPVA